MKRRLLCFSMLLTLVSALTVMSTGVAFASARLARTSSSCITSGSTNTLTGTIGGANYLIQVPANWNGTLLLYSHGYVFPGSPLTPHDASDSLTGGALFRPGHALARCSFCPNGWGLPQAFPHHASPLGFLHATSCPSPPTLP